MAVYTYDPKQVTAVVGGKIMTGWTDGTFIHVERNEDTWALKVGCDSIGTRAKSTNRSAKITLTFHQSSPSNDVLAALAVADERANAGAVTFLLRDGNGTTVVSCLTMWVTKPAPIDFSKEVSDRAWVLETDNANIFVGSETLL